MENKRYSAADFVKALASKELETERAVTIVGMVKVDEAQPNVLLLAPRGCGTWIPIPLTAIADVEDLGSRACKDHVHRVARVRLKESKSPEALILHAILSVEEQSDDGHEPALEARSFRGEARVPARRRNGFDCVRACNICRRFPWKSGPCSVCEEQCGGDYEDDIDALRLGGGANECTDCLANCRGKSRDARFRCVRDCNDGPCGNGY